MTMALKRGCPSHSDMLRQDCPPTSPAHAVATSSFETIVGCAHSFLELYPYFRDMIPVPRTHHDTSLVHICSRLQELAARLHVAEMRCFLRIPAELAFRSQPHRQAEALSAWEKMHYSARIPGQQSGRAR
jgi:hypothetical protein